MWFIPIILALGRQKQEDCCKLEFKVSLDYSVQFYLKTQNKQTLLQWLMPIIFE